MKTQEELAAEQAAAEAEKQRLAEESARAQQNTEAAKAAGGDKGKALAEEREKRKAAQAETNALREELARIRGGGASGGAENIEAIVEGAIGDLSEVDVIGDPKALRAKFAKGVAAAMQATSQQIMQTVGSRQAAGEIEAMIDKYTIFRDDNEALARHANAAVALALRALPNGATLQQIEQVVAETAKEFSKYKVAAAGTPAAGAGRQAPLPTASGGAAVTAVKEEVKRPANWEEAGDKARELARKAWDTITGGRK